LDNFNINTLKKSLPIKKKNSLKIEVLQRNWSLNFFNLSNFFLLKNGKFLKKIYILSFFLNYKFGEFFNTRSKYVYLKKNKKTIKR